MKRITAQIAVAALAALTAGCINNDYDLAKLDTEVTILPGFTVPISITEDQVLDLDGTFLNDEDSHSGTDEEGTIVIGRKDENQVSVTAPSTEEIQETVRTEKLVIEIPGVIVIPCADEFSRLIPGATFNIPLKPVIEINNPTDFAMDFTATLTCGEDNVEIGPYRVNGGLSKITITDEAVQKFFSPIKYNIIISGMKLTCEQASESSAAFRTRAEEQNQISVYGYVPVELDGQEFTIDYSVEEKDLNEIDIAKLRQDYKFTVPMFTASAKITSNIPVAITASATAKVNTGSAKDKEQGPFSFNRPVASGSLSAPVTTEISASVDLDSDTESFSEIVITAVCKPDGAFSLQPQHTLSYSDLVITFTDGITINPGK